MNVVFFGATQFGLKCLETLLTINDVNITGVLTGKQLFNISYSKNKPVYNVLYADFQAFCAERGIPCAVLKDKMTDPELINIIQHWNPEFILVIGWYHIVPKQILDMAKKGVAGIHASLLPKYRGGAPLVWALINGESETGVSFFFLDEGVDTGKIIDQRKIPIKLNDTIKTLYTKVEQEGINMLRENMPLIIKNTHSAFEQSIPYGIHQKAWPPRSPEDGEIDWSKGSIEIYNYIRAQTMPYPGAFTYLKEKKITIWECKLFDWSPKCGQEGEVIGFVTEGPLKGILVATKDNDCSLLFTHLEVEGRHYTGIEFIEKNMISVGDYFKNMEYK